MRTFLFILGFFLLAAQIGTASANTAPPSSTARLIFIHHSVGENWLADDNGALGIALRDNNYFVSDTNYGWGPNQIGDNTDIGHWWLWFRGPDSGTYLSSLYQESAQHAGYSRLASGPAGENEIILFKSCFPNSSLQGNPDDPVPAIDNNPLRGEGSGSEHHTVANAKGIYIDLLEYFRSRQDKLFIVITAPPQQDPTYAANARAFNNWLVNDWLRYYSYSNVAVFDFFNVMTTNGGNISTNDLGQIGGNHHRWYNNTIQHVTTGDDDASPNTLEYPSDDDHPNRAGNLKATGELLPLLNTYYNRWKLGMAGWNPMPSLRANGTDGTVTASASEPVHVTAALSPNNMNGIAADWWAWADTPFGRYWFTLDLGWVPSDTPIRVYDGPLFDMPSYPIADGVLSAGTYQVHFAVDNNLDGIFDGTYGGSLTLILQ